MAHALVLKHPSLLQQPQLSSPHSLLTPGRVQQCRNSSGALLVLRPALLPVPIQQLSSALVSHRDMTVQDNFKFPHWYLQMESTTKIF